MLLPLTKQEYIVAFRFISKKKMEEVTYGGRKMKGYYPSTGKNMIIRYVSSLVGKMVDESVGIKGTVEDNWVETLNYFNEECIYCETKENLTREHLIPIMKGGLHCKSNVVPACLSCNRERKDSISWECFLKKKSSKNAADKTEKIKSIKEYTECKGKLNKVNELEIVKKYNVISDKVVTIIDSAAYGLVDEFLEWGKGSYDYYYHIAYESDWEEAKQKGAYFIAKENNKEKHPVWFPYVYIESYVNFIYSKVEGSVVLIRVKISDLDEKYTHKEIEGDIFPEIKMKLEINKLDVKKIKYRKKKNKEYYYCTNLNDILVEDWDN